MKQIKEMIQRKMKRKNQKIIWGRKRSDGDHFDAFERISQQGEILIIVALNQQYLVK